MKLKLGKIVKAVSIGYALYKANQEEADALINVAKRVIKNKKKRGLPEA